MPGPYWRPPIGRIRRPLWPGSIHPGGSRLTSPLIFLSSIHDLRYALDVKDVHPRSIVTKDANLISGDKGLHLFLVALVVAVLGGTLLDGASPPFLVAAGHWNAMAWTERTNHALFSSSF